MTALLNGQAVKIALGSTSVTASRGSKLFKVRAQVAPAKPPPSTTTRPAAPCDSAGRNDHATQGAIAARARNARRVSRRPLITGASWFLPGIPFGNCYGLGFGEAFGDPVHHRRRTLAGAKVPHRRDHIRGRTA